MNRRVNVYTEAITSIESVAFREYCEEIGYGKIINTNIDDAWMADQLLKAAEIKAELSMYDEESAEKYWKIISHIYDSEHYFDGETYEELKNKIKKELN